jgi:hypothetical protein
MIKCLYYFQLINFVEFFHHVNAFFFSMARQPFGDLGRLNFRSFTITFRHITLGRTPLDEWSARRRDLKPDNTQQSQQTDIHAPGGMRTHDPSKRAAVDPHLRPHGHWDRRKCIIIDIINTALGFGGLSWFEEPRFWKWGETRRWDDNVSIKML